MMGDWVQMGPHRYRLVDELVYLETGGAFSAEHATELLELLKRLDEEQEALGLVVDLHAGVQLPPDTRRAFAEHTDPNKTPLPMLVIGASPAVRTLLTLLLNGMRLLLRVDIPVRFCKDREVESALVWLHEKVRARARREAMRSSAKPPASATSHNRVL